MERYLDAGDLVVVYPSTLAPSFRRYAGTGVELVTYPRRMESGPTRFSRYVESFSDPAELAEVLDRVAERAPSACRIWLVRQALNSRTADSTSAPGTTEHWRHRYEAGLEELGGRLRAWFGGPDIELPAGDSAFVRERVSAAGYRTAHGGAAGCGEGPG
jgi:hypothetical protein